MRACIYALAVGIALGNSAVRAHGPQIQITIDSDKIVTRELILEEPYTALTPPKSVYVIPLRELSGVWYARPNNTPSPTIPGVPQYPSGPGFAYGYDMVDGGPQEFAEGSIVSVAMLGGLKHWDGTAFVDTLATQLKAFRGTDPNILGPGENFALTSDSGPYDELLLPTIPANYAPSAHTSLRYALMGASGLPTSGHPDGIYLLGMGISSTQFPLAGSDPYYFVLSKNADMRQVVAAVQSLGFAPSEVQWLVPEPGTLALAVLCWSGVFSLCRRATPNGEVSNVA